MANDVTVYLNDIYSDRENKEQHVSVLSMDMYGRHYKKTYSSTDVFCNDLLSGLLVKRLMSVHEDVSFHINFICRFTHLESIDTINNDNYKFTQDEVEVVKKYLGIKNKGTTC